LTNLTLPKGERKKGIQYTLVKGISQVVVL